MTLFMLAPYFKQPALSLSYISGKLQKPEVAMHASTWVCLHSQSISCQQCSLAVAVNKLHSDTTFNPHENVFINTESDVYV